MDIIKLKEVSCWFFTLLNKIRLKKTKVVKQNFELNTTNFF